MINNFNFWLLLVAMSYATVTAEKAKTEIVKDSINFSLHINGVEVYLKGFNGLESAERTVVAANYGANAARIYCFERDKDFTAWTMPAIGWAVQQNIYVLAYWEHLSRNPADYTEPYKAIKREQVRVLAEKLKDIENVFMIMIGNELDNGVHEKDISQRAPIYQFVNELALIVKSICPNKLVSTAIMQSGSVKIINAVVDYCPAFDVLCLNAYGNVAYIDNAVKNSKWKGAYLLSEWGEDGHWDFWTRENGWTYYPKTSWGAFIEQTSEQKRSQLESRYAAAFKDKLPRCLGSFYFYWGSRWEYTPTWFNAFVEKNASIGINGEQSAIADALHQCWKGTAPAQTAPVVTAITIDGKTPASSIKVNANTTFISSVTATDKEQSSLTYKWEILEDTGSINARPGIVKSTNTNTATFSVPAAGNYRLYVYVLDGTGRVGTANTPFQVQ